MKYATLFSAVLLPMVASAAVTDTLLALDSQGVFSSISLWSMLIVAFTTSAMVWWGGRKMHGGILGSVLTYMSVGMTAVFLGIVTEIPQVASWSPLYAKLAHDSLFIIGYIIMGVAANKLLNVIKGE